MTLDVMTDQAAPAAGAPTGPLRVWVAAEQMPCCVEPFAVGSAVSWQLDPKFDRSFLEIALGAELTAKISHAVQMHDPLRNGEPEPHSIRRPTGAVRSIRAVYCLYGPAKDAAEDAPTPVPGSGVASYVVRATGEPEELANRDLVLAGYVAKLSPGLDASEGVASIDYDEDFCDFYVEDEPIEKIRAAWESGQPAITAPPADL